MNTLQTKAIQLALNVLYMDFFECPKHFHQYFISSDEWALLLLANGTFQDADYKVGDVAVAVLNHAVARKGFFEKMGDFKPGPHICSFIKEKVDRKGYAFQLDLNVQAEQTDCPYATYRILKLMADRVKESQKCKWINESFPSISSTRTPFPAARPCRPTLCR